MKLLVGIERSDRTPQVLETAVERARTDDDSLTVAVVETGNGPSLDHLEQEVREQLSALSFDAEVRSLSGHAGSQLVDLAEEEDFDQLILDGGQTSPLGKIQIDDATEFVLLNASMTVTLVR
jgi:nucleotide-binding universal stress UspA family protein